MWTHTSTFNVLCVWSRNYQLFSFVCLLFVLSGLAPLSNKRKIKVEYDQSYSNDDLISLIEVRKLIFNKC